MLDPATSEISALYYSVSAQFILYRAPSFIVSQLIWHIFENIIRSSEVGQDDLRGVYIHILEEHVEVLV